MCFLCWSITYKLGLCFSLFTWLTWYHYISGLDSQISRRCLDRVPLLPTSAGFALFPHTSTSHRIGIHLSNSIGHKLFVALLTSYLMQDYSTVCPSVHRPHYISFQSFSYFFYKVVGAMWAEISSNLGMVSPFFANRALLLTDPGAYQILDTWLHTLLLLSLSH